MLMMAAEADDDDDDGDDDDGEEDEDDDAGDTLVSVASDTSLASVVSAHTIHPARKRWW